MHLYICDLHFAENCFQQHKAVVNKDKFKVIVPRQRLGLKAGSVPSIFQVSTYIFFKTLLARIIHFYKTIFFLFWVVQPECIDYREPTAGFSKYFRQFELSPNEYPTTTNYPAVYTAKVPRNDNFHLSILPQLLNIKTPATPSQFSNPASQSAVASISENDAQGDNISAVMAPVGRYSIASLINDWNSIPSEKVPKHWAMVKTNVGVLLGYYGDTFKSETRSILVGNDMTTEASVQHD